MAHESEDREDLLAEATALVERAAIVLPGVSPELVAGFRSDGCASLYFGSDPAYHFNSRQQLRRAFAGGLLYKAERGRLVSLNRKRSDQEVQLIRHELNDAALAAFLGNLHSRLNALHNALNVLLSGGDLLPADAAGCRVVGQVPDDADVPGRLAAWLANLAMKHAAAGEANDREIDALRWRIEIAAEPNAR